MIKTLLIAIAVLLVISCATTKEAQKQQLQAIQIMAIVTEWTSKAIEDGKVTLDEAVALTERICQVLEIPTEINVPLKQPPQKKGGNKL